MRIIEIYGDSVMRGVIYSQEEKRYKLCEDHKFTSFSQNDIYVTNNARMGFTISDGFSTIKKRIDSIEKNSTVLLEFGGNDCDFNWKEISENPKGTFEPNVNKDDFMRLYFDVIDLIREKGAFPIICSIIPIDAEKYFNFISQGLDMNAILTWLGDVTMLSRWQEYYNLIIEKIAVMKDCAILDLRSAFLTAKNFKGLLCADGIHPTQLGHDLIKTEIRKFITA